MTNLKYMIRNQAYVDHNRRKRAYTEHKGRKKASICASISTGKKQFCGHISLFGAYLVRRQTEKMSIKRKKNEQYGSRSNYEIRNQWAFAILEAITTDWDLSQWKCNDRLQQAASLIIYASESHNYWFGPDSWGEIKRKISVFNFLGGFCLIYR